MRHRPLPAFAVADDTRLAGCMRLAQDGDRDAYARLLAECRDAFASLARERCPAGCSEAEAVRRCLLTLHDIRHTFDPDRSFSAWVGAIARHHGIGAAPLPERGVGRARIAQLLRDVLRSGSQPEGTA